MRKIKLKKKIKRRNRARDVSTHARYFVTLKHDLQAGKLDSITLVKKKKIDQTIEKRSKTVYKM